MPNRRKTSSLNFQMYINYRTVMFGIHGITDRRRNKLISLKKFVKLSPLLYGKTSNSCRRSGWRSTEDELWVHWPKAHINSMVSLQFVSGSACVCVDRRTVFFFLSVTAHREREGLARPHTPEERTRELLPPRPELQ